MTDDLPQLVSELRSIASQNVCDLPNMGDEAHEPPEITWGELDAIGRTADAAATALDTLTRALAEQQAENAELRKDLAFHTDCRPNRREAESAIATLTAAVREARAETEQLRREVNYQRARAVDAEARLAAESVRATAARTGQP